jgi:hypothetical protein
MTVTIIIAIIVMVLEMLPALPVGRRKSPTTGRLHPLGSDIEFTLLLGFPMAGLPNMRMPVPLPKAWGPNESDPRWRRRFDDGHGWGHANHHVYVHLSVHRDGMDKGPNDGPYGQGADKLHHH